MIYSKIQKQPKVKTSPHRKSAPPELSAENDRIRERAFQIFGSRGGEPGHDVQDWLHAEHHILER
jgi:hypothetical protein